MAIIELTQKTFEEEVLGAKIPVLLFFYKENDTDCQKLEALVTEVAEELPDQVKVCKVNVDKEIMLALNYQVLDLPLLIFTNYGIFRERLCGLTDKATILSTLDRISGDFTL